MIRLWPVNYFNNRRKRQSKLAYNNGFGWAMAEYYLDGQTLEQIEAYVYGCNDYFDLGVNAALRILAQLGGRDE